MSCIAEILHNEDVALGLAQPQGIGQRPRHLSVDLTTGQPTLVQVLRFKNKDFFPYYKFIVIGTKQQKETK